MTNICSPRVKCYVLRKKLRQLRRSYCNQNTMLCISLTKHLVEVTDRKDQILYTNLNPMIHELSRIHSKAQKRHEAQKQIEISAFVTEKFTHKSFQAGNDRIVHDFMVLHHCCPRNTSGRLSLRHHYNPLLHCRYCWKHLGSQVFVFC